MARESDSELARWEEERDLGPETLSGLRDIQAGRTGRRFNAQSYLVIRAREKVGLSQAQFAKLLGVSVRTLQDWEQGRRQPSGAAKALTVFPPPL